MVINDTFFWRSLQDRVLYMHITFDCSFINCLFVSDDFCDIFSVPEKRTTILSYINFISLFVMISTYICKCTNFREIYFLVLWKQSPKDPLQKSYPVNLQEIYRRAAMENCDFNEVSLQPCAEHLFEEPQWGMLIFLNSLTNHRY